MALYNGNGFFSFCFRSRQTLATKKIAPEILGKLVGKGKMELRVGGGESVDREKYVLPDDKMKNCDIDKCDINGKTLGEFKKFTSPDSFAFPPSNSPEK